MRKSALIMLAAGVLLSGCSRVTIQTPSGYKVTYTRCGLIPRQYTLQDMSVVASNLTVTVGAASVGVSSNSVSAIQAVGDVAGKCVSAAVKEGLSAGIK